MANLKGIAARFSRRAKRTQKNVDKLVKKTALAIHQQVVLATPVDTGRARGNWHIGLDSPVRAETSELDPIGSATISAGQAVIARHNAGQDVFVSNNVDYIGALNDGWSAQAPAMFIEQAMQRGVDIVRKTKVVD